MTKYRFDASVGDHGVVDYGGVELLLVQDAWIDGDVYRASAVDTEGNDYFATWDMLPEFDPLLSDEEGDACSWEVCRVQVI